MINPLEYFINVKNQGTAAFTSLQAEIKATTTASKAANVEILSSHKATQDQMYTISKAQTFATIDNKKREAAALYEISKAQFQAHAENEARKVAASKAANDAIVAANKAANVEMLANLRATSAAASATGIPGGMLLGGGASMLASPAGATVAGVAALIAGIAGIAAATRSFGDQIERVDNLAASTGLGVRNVQILQQVAKETQVEFGALSTTVIRFQAALGKGEGMDEFGESVSKLRKNLNALGIDTHKGAVETLLQLKDVLDQVGSREKAQQILLDTLGVRAKSIAPLLLNVDTNLRGLMDTIGESNVVISGPGLEAARQWDGVWDAIGRSITSAKNSLLEFIAISTIGSTTPTPRGTVNADGTPVKWNAGGLTVGGLTIRDQKSEAKARYESTGMAPMDVKIMLAEAEQKKAVAAEDWNAAAAIKARIVALKEQQIADRNSIELMKAKAIAQAQLDQRALVGGALAFPSYSSTVYNPDGTWQEPDRPPGFIGPLMGRSVTHLGYPIPRSGEIGPGGAALGRSGGSLLGAYGDAGLDANSAFPTLSYPGVPGREFGPGGTSLGNRAADQLRTIMDAPSQKIIQAGGGFLRIVDESAKAFDHEIRSSAGNMFDALISHSRSGILDVLKAAVLIPARTIFGNIMVEIFSGVQKTLGGAIGGQVDPVTGERTRLGRILRGTPLGVSDAQVFAAKAEAIRAAQHQTTNELLQKIADPLNGTNVSGANGGTSGGGLAGLAGVIFAGGGSSGGGGFINQGFGGKGPFGGGTSGGGLGGPFTPDSGWGGFKAGLGSPSSVWESLGVYNGENSSPDGLSTAQKAGSTVAAAGVIAAGAYGVYSGVKRGGVGGYSQAIGAAAGTAAALDPEPISKAVLEGVAITAGIVSFIAGDPKKNRAEEIARTIEGEKYYANTPMFGNRQFSLGGFEESNGRAGSFGPVAPGSEQSRSVNITVHAMDSKSFIDHAQDISAAVSHGITSGQAPQLVQSLREAN